MSDIIYLVAFYMITKRKAALILLLEGLASSGLQMITIRQTVPFVGSSVLCTSIIISCFLGALALGYYWGGQQASERYAKSLVNNLLGSIALFGIGLSYSFVSFFFLSIRDHSDGCLKSHDLSISNFFPGLYIRVLDSKLWGTHRRFRGDSPHHGPPNKVCY